MDECLTIATGKVTQKAVLGTAELTSNAVKAISAPRLGEAARERRRRSKEEKFNFEQEDYSKSHFAGIKPDIRVTVVAQGYRCDHLVATPRQTGEHPERVIMKAVERMLPKTKMGRAQIGKLRVYAGAEHPHEAQQPMAIDVAALNAKNKRSA